jgi:serine/threonine protein kinase
MSIKKISGYSIRMKEILGHGSFGCVYRGEDQSKKPCAIKVLDKKLSTDINS